MHIMLTEITSFVHHSYNSFYFFNFFTKPRYGPIGVHILCYIRYMMSNKAFQSIFINVCFFRHRYKLLSTIMCRMCIGAASRCDGLLENFSICIIIQMRLTFLW